MAVPRVLNVQQRVCRGVLTRQVGFEVHGELDGGDAAVIGRGAQDGSGVADVGDHHRVTLLDDGQRSGATVDCVEAAAVAELFVDGSGGGQVGLFPEVELGVAELLLTVDERRQRDGLLPAAQQRWRQRVSDGLGDVVAPLAVAVKDTAEDGVLLASEPLKRRRKPQNKYTFSLVYISV
jgi:hypothetical protein